MSAKITKSTGKGVESKIKSSSPLTKAGPKSTKKAAAKPRTSRSPKPVPMTVAQVTSETKMYSLKDIFGVLDESLPYMFDEREITVIADHGDYTAEFSTTMSLHHFIGMQVATELCSDYSRVVGAVPKEAVIEAMMYSHYDEVAFPNYEHVGIQTS